MKAKVNINFIDQDGNEVSSDKLPNSRITGVHIGQKLHLPNTTDDAYHNYGLPAGYQVVTGQPDYYVVPQKNNNAYVYVTGDQETATAKVNLVYKDGNGQNVSDVQSDPVQLSGDVNDIVNFYPSTITPKAGYQLNTDKTAGSFPARIDANNSSNWTTTYGPVHMQDGTTINNGDPTVFFKDVQAVLTTVYINQSGNVVGHPNTIEGTAGKSVNVTDPSDNGEAIPQGYTLDGGDQTQDGHKSDSDVIGTDQDTQYKLNAGHHTVYLHVDGNQENNMSVKVLCVLHNRDGSTMVDQDSEYPLGNIRVGGMVNVSPDDPQLDSYHSGYAIAPSDVIQPVTVSADGVLPQTVVFNYDQSSNTNSESITYHFYDQETNREVSSGIGTGKIGTSYNPTTDPNDHVPNGYRLADNSSNYNYTFSNVLQDVWIPVIGNRVNNQFTIYQIENHLDGSRTITSVSISVSYDIGQSFHISPYGFSYQDGGSTKTYSVPNGYHADPSDQDMDIQVKGDGQLSRSSVAYGYSQNYKPSAIGGIKIHYVTSAGVPSNSANSDIDDVSDHGIDNDQFILRPFQDDLPDTLTDSYQSVGKVYDHFGHLMNQADIDSLKFTGGQAKNIYIQIEKIN